MTEPLLEISDLRVSFGDVTAVHSADLTIQPGERVAIVGASGSGKSTLAHAIMGLLPGSGRVAGGAVRWRGEDITHADEKRLRSLRGKEIGLVPQDPMSNLNPVSRVGRQVSETLVAHRICTRRAAKEQAVELLGQAGLPEPGRRARQYPHEFSGGMRQRVLIAIGLACRPDLLIADEPTSALDVTVQRQILDHLEKLTQELGTALLLVTHDLGLAAERADRVVVMSDGRIVETGPARQVLTDPQEEYTQRLVAAAPALVTPRRNVKADKAAEDKAAEDKAVERTPILQVANITKEYKIRGRGGLLKAVDDVSFTIGRGRTTAIVGESGSGKTTTARIVLGLINPTSGSVKLDGADMVGLQGERLRAARRAMQPVFQDPYASLDPMWTVERLITEPLRAFGVGDRASRRARVAELLDQVALSASLAQRYPNELSGGQRQRVAIARALAVDPPLVVCDEAVSALDVLVQDQILTLLSSLQEQLGISYLFISHDLAVVRAIAHDVLVMRNGRVVEQGPVAEVLTAPTDQYTRQLLAAIPGIGVLGGGVPDVLEVDFEAAESKTSTVDIEKAVVEETEEASEEPVAAAVAVTEDAPAEAVSEEIGLDEEASSKPVAGTENGPAVEAALAKVEAAFGEIEVKDSATEDVAAVAAEIEEVAAVPVTVTPAVEASAEDAVAETVAAEAVPAEAAATDVVVESDEAKPIDLVEAAPAESEPVSADVVTAAVDTDDAVEKAAATETVAAEVASTEAAPAELAETETAVQDAAAPELAETETVAQDAAVTAEVVAPEVAADDAAVEGEPVKSASAEVDSAKVVADDAAADKGAAEVEPVKSAPTEEVSTAVAVAATEAVPAKAPAKKAAPRKTAAKKAATPRKTAAKKVPAKKGVRKAAPAKAADAAETGTAAKTTAAAKKTAPKQATAKDGENGAGGSTGTAATDSGLAAEV